MNKLIFAGALTAALIPAQAQLFSADSLAGAAWGGLAGGIIGNNSGHKTAEGAAIGAGAGLLLGALVNHARREQSYYAPPSPAPAAPVYYSPAASYYPGYYAYPAPRPNYAVTGAALGGLAGGIIGHNSGRRTAEGIALGAGAGLLLGSLAEQNARRHETAAYVAPSANDVISETSVGANVPPAASAAIPQPPPTINNNDASQSAMSGANSLFGR